MAKEASTAPRERVNITYKPATGDAKEETELPLKVVMIGDYTLKADDRPLEERRPINIDKDNFQDVLKSQELSLDLNVEDRLTEADDEEMAVHVEFESLKDFGPEAVARQVPELNKLVELREALKALKGPLGNIPNFRKALQSMMGNEGEVTRLIAELGGGDDSSNASPDSAATEGE